VFSKIKVIMRMGRLISSVALATAFVAGAALVSSSASASSINVANPSFETNTAGLPFTAGCGNSNPTCAYNDGPISGWNTSGGQTGQQNLGNLLVPENGSLEAYANGNGTSIYQTVSATAIAGNTYTLDVYVGNRTDGYNGPVTVQLNIGGIITDASGLAPLSGGWSLWTASYVAGVSGAPITIDLISGGLQGNFDNVSLTATPLPSTWTMLIAGFVGLGFFAYRATKKGSAAVAAA
jgi:HpiC1 cyclase